MCLVKICKEVHQTKVKKKPEGINIIFMCFPVRYVRANVEFDHGTKVTFSPDTRYNAKSM